jgi:hypothetical protein
MDKMKNQATTMKKNIYKKGNQQYRKTHYVDNNSWKEADLVQAGNQRGGWR